MSQNLCPNSFRTSRHRHYPRRRGGILSRRTLQTQYIKIPTKYFKNSKLKSNKSFAPPQDTYSIDGTRHSIPRTQDTYPISAEGQPQKNRIDWSHIWIRFLAVAQKFFGLYNMHKSFLNAFFIVWEDILDLVSHCFSIYGS